MNPVVESAMPTPVSVSCLIRLPHVATGDVEIGGLGGMFNGRPWHLSEANIIAEVEKPVSRRQWDFFLSHGNQKFPIVVIVRNGRKCLAATADSDRSNILLSLPECPDYSEKDVFNLPRNDAPRVSTVPGPPGKKGEPQLKAASREISSGPKCARGLGLRGMCGRPLDRRRRTWQPRCFLVHPGAVIGFVVAVLVEATEHQMRLRLTSHVREKRAEIGAPLLAHIDTLASVPRECGVSRDCHSGRTSRTRKHIPVFACNACDRRA
jgi:hypothetical protein